MDDRRQEEYQESCCAECGWETCTPTLCTLKLLSCRLRNKKWIRLDLPVLLRKDLVFSLMPQGLNSVHIR